MTSKTIMAFDLSSACIGVIAVRIENNKIITMRSCPIMPPVFDASVLGYLKSKKKVPTKNGAFLNTYIKQGETTITQAEKKKRDQEVRSKKDIYVLEYIGSVMGGLIRNIKPDLILVEKNAIFNGVLTTVLLAKVMGTLVGIAGMNGIHVEEYAVNKVRSIINITQLLREFTENKSGEELKMIPDITKRVLRFEMERLYGQYGIKFQTDDESDACCVWHYWYAVKGE